MESHRPLVEDVETPDTKSVEEGIRFHYDLPPEFFALFLDKATMSYTCAYFRDGTDTIDQAQLRKLDLVARKLDLRPGDRVLDIGVGWGNMAFYAAERGCHVTGITLAVEQARYIEEEAARRGLGDKIKVIVQEARTLPFEDASFDKVVTIGASEQMADIAVLFQHVSRVLTPGGLCLQHSITRSNEPQVLSPELEFMIKHIFPTGKLKSLGEYATVFEQADLEVIDVHDMTDHYPLTLLRWLRALEAAGEEGAAAVGVPGDRYRAQRLFLAGCIVSFTDGHSFLYQELLRKTTPGLHRTPLAAGRGGLDLPDSSTEPLPSPLLPRPVVSVEVEGGMTMWVDGAESALTAGEPPSPPDCRIRVSMSTFSRISTGQLDLIDGFLQGLIDVEGDVLAAAQVGSALLRLAG